MENSQSDQEILVPDAKVREAALSVDESFIIQAPAGSGKTSLLIARYLTLLAESVNEPEELLAMTFTKKAAQEMKTRIQDALIQGGEGAAPAQLKHDTVTLAKRVLEKDKRLGWGLLTNPHRIRVMTMDALCASLVKQAPMQTLLPEPMQMLENDDLYCRAVKDLFSHIEEKSPLSRAIANLFLHLDNQYHLFERLLVDLLKKREQWLMHLHLGQVDAQALRKTLERNLECLLLESVAALQAEAALTQCEQLREAIAFAVSHLESSHFLSSHYHAWLEEGGKIQSVSFWKMVASFVLTKTGEFRRSLDVRIGFPAGKTKAEKVEAQQCKIETLALIQELQENQLLARLIKEIPYWPSECYETSQWDCLQDIFTILPVLLAHLQLNFQIHSKVDYVEVLLKALHALGSDEAPTDLLLRLDYKIQHLLVDEFQDTSYAQFHLIEKLVSNWLLEEKRTLFLVGDPMQSIYRFRKAEVGLFLKAQERGVGNIRLKSLVLKSNFRSDPEIVNFNNELFSSIFPNYNEKIIGAIAYSPSIAMRRQAVPGKIIFARANEDCPQDEAMGMLEAIQAQRAHSPQTRIAILVRSRRHLSSLITTLKSAQLPFNASEIHTLFELSLIQDLYALTRAICFLTDKVAWLAVLRAPYCGLSLLEIAEITKQNEVIWQACLSYENNPNASAPLKNQIQRILPAFQVAISLKQQVSLSSLIRQLADNLGFFKIYSGKENHDYAERFFQILHELDLSGDLPNRLSLESRLKEIKISEHAHEPFPIELMTIHKAKGLEFDMVMLPSLQASTLSDSHTLMLWMEYPHSVHDETLIIAPLKPVEVKEHDKIYHYLRYIESEKAKQELFRLFYVACTRAKSILYFSWMQDGENNAAPSGSFLSLIQDKIDPALILPIKPSENRNAPRASLRRYTGPLPLIPQKTTKTKTEETQLELTLSAIRQRRNVGIVFHRALLRRIQGHMPSFEKVKEYAKTLLLSLGTPILLTDSASLLIAKTMQEMEKTKEGLFLLSPHQQDKFNLPVLLYEGTRREQLMIDRWFQDENGQHYFVLFKMTEEITGGDKSIQSLEKAARHLLPDARLPVCFIVYYPFQLKIVKKVSEAWESSMNFS